MPPETEIEVIENKLKELADLVEKREQAQARIAKTEAAIRAFIELLDDEHQQKFYSARLSDTSKPLGLTEAVKRVLRATGESLNAMAVRDALVASGFSISGYASPLAVVHTTLNRLNEQGLAERVGDGFKWIETTAERFLRIAQEKRGSTQPRRFKPRQPGEKIHPKVRDWGKKPESK